MHQEHIRTQETSVSHVHCALLWGTNTIPPLFNHHLSPDFISYHCMDVLISPAGKKLVMVMSLEFIMY